MAKIEYSKAAIRDLENIGDYIAMELNSPIVALNTVSHILDAADKLSEFPRIGSPLSARYENVGDYRYLVCKSYLVFYREQANVVYIDRILYGRRDYLKILFSDMPDNEIE